MKKSATMLKIAVIILSAALLLYGGGCSDDDDDAKFNVEWVRSGADDSEIQDLFQKTNGFRTGNEANYKDEKGKTVTVSNLNALQLDEELCKAAVIRAEEIVQSFSHTRPNGSSCFSILKDCSISYGWAAENIAAGSSTGAATFNQWKEDGKDYSGQGHRRNMLSTDSNKIGLAYAYSPEATYKYYWVMILTN